MQELSGSQNPSVFTTSVCLLGPCISSRSSQGHRPLQYSQHLSVCLLALHQLQELSGSQNPSVFTTSVCKGPTSAVGALRIIEPFSIHNICLSVCKGPTSVVGALRVIEPFSIHNICLSVCLSVKALHQLQELSGSQTPSVFTSVSVCKGRTSAVGALGVIDPFSIHNICLPVCLSVKALHQLQELSGSQNPSVFTTSVCLSVCLSVKALHQLQELSGLQNPSVFTTSVCL